MRERLEKAIPQKNDGGERLEKARGRLEKAITQKNDGGKGWKKPGEGWKRPYPRKMMRGKHELYQDSAVAYLEGKAGKGMPEG